MVPLNELCPFGIWTGPGCSLHYGLCDCLPKAKIHLGVYKNYVHFTSVKPLIFENCLFTYRSMKRTDVQVPLRPLALQIRKQSFSFVEERNGEIEFLQGSVKPVQFPIESPFGLIRNQTPHVLEEIKYLLFLGEKLQQLNQIGSAFNRKLWESLSKIFQPKTQHEQVLLTLYTEQIRMSFWAHMFFPSVRQISKHLDELLQGYCVVGDRIVRVLQWRDCL